MEGAPAVLSTARLVLRRPVLEDAGAIFEEYAQDLEVTRYLGWRPHARVEETREFVKRCLASWASGDEYVWVITATGSDRPVGAISCRVRGHTADVGYVLTRSLWGQGFMTEAVRAVVAWALSVPSVHRVWAVCDTANTASARVLEKAGMSREGTLRRWMIHPNVSSDPRDCFVYSRVRERA